MSAWSALRRRHSLRFRAHCCWRLFAGAMGRFEGAAQLPRLRPPSGPGIERRWALAHAAIELPAQSPRSTPLPTALSLKYKSAKNYRTWC